MFHSVAVNMVYTHRTVLESTGIFQ